MSLCHALNGEFQRAAGPTSAVPLPAAGRKADRQWQLGRNG